MTPIPAATTAGVSAMPLGAPPTNPNGELGQDGFLKLMIAQLQAQNPMQPGNTNEYINEMATFTQLEQITNLASSSELTSGVQLIGHEVSYANGEGALQSGTVEGAQRSAAGVTLTIGGVRGIELAKVTEVS